jgi:hypothetical protein
MAGAGHRGDRGTALATQTGVAAPGVSLLSLISYDHDLLLDLLPRLLPFVDEVLLGLDRDRLSWAGRPIGIPDAFFDALRRLDGAEKIRIVERPFYAPGRTPMELDTAERNALAAEATPGSWLVSVDADERLLDPEGFFRWLATAPPDRCVMASWITVYKDLGDAALVVTARADGGLEQFPLATRGGPFTSARYTAQPKIDGPAVALHFSWSRSEAALRTKLENWSHRADFDLERALAAWRALDGDSYAGWRDFHPIWPGLWPGLQKVAAGDLDQLRPGDLRRAPAVARPARAGLRRVLSHVLTLI